MHVRFVDVGGVLTRYYEAGSGEPLVLVHGVGVASDSWMRNIAPLGKHFRVLALDLIGCGLTPPGGYQSGPPQPVMAQHLLAFMDAVGVGKACLVGSSLGGWIVALAALAQPQRVSKLVFVGCSVLLTDRIATLGAGFARVYENGRRAYAENTYESCLQRMKNLVYDPGCIPEALLYLQMTSNAQPWSLPAFEVRMRGLTDFEAGRPYQIGSRLRDLNCPKLVISGREDPRDPADGVAAVFSGLPDTRMMVFERCGHFPFLEHPEWFNEAVTAFVRGSSS